MDHKYQGKSRAHYIYIWLYGVNTALKSRWCDRKILYAFTRRNKAQCVIFILVCEQGPIVNIPWHLSRTDADNSVSTR